jgi:coniferyl-aldehyde dehydrogenase
MRVTDAPSSLASTFERMHAASRSHPFPTLAERRAMLDGLIGAIADSKHRIAEAIDADFGGRSIEESLQAEIVPALTFLKHARRHLARWMRPERRWIALKYLFASNRVVYQPLGVVGVIGPWNYPVALSVGPLVASLAAGNRTIICLSGRVPRTADVLGDILARTLPDFAWMAPANRETAVRMTALPFDRLMFTGSTEVGRKVMRAAADNLTPVTLELGGKSPAIVHPDYPPAKAAGRIAWGKFLNAGQTCIAPDYALVHRPALPAFVDAVGDTIRRLYPDAPANPDYTALVDDEAFEKVAGLVADARARGATVTQFPGNAANGNPRKLPPTVVADVTDDMRVMQEEIFGPVLAIRAYDDFEEVFPFLAARPQPLALYYFDNDRARVARVLRETMSGGVAVNDTLLQFMQEALPFGGVGDSGMGRYHGFEGFVAMSNERAVYRAGPLNLHRLVHPPYRAYMRFLIDRATRRTPF